MKSWHRFSLITAFVGTLGLALFLPSQAVLAADDCGSSEYDAVSAPAEYVAGPVEKYTLEQPFGGKSQVANIGEYIQLVYSFALGIVGIIAVVLIMFGGLRWLAAAGNESIIGEAKEIIVSAVTGLVIALLSYSILAFVNPQTLNTDVSVFKIPIPIKCSYPDPATAPIPTIDPGLDGNGHSLCSGGVTALQNVVEVMLNGTDGPGGDPGICPGCTLDISSGVRTHEKQAELRSCYERAVASGNPDVCPAGCETGCNLAAKVCCSEHEHAKAIDVALTGVTQDGILDSSAGFRKTSQNNGAKGGAVNVSTCDGVPNKELCENQRLLNTIMTATGEFTGISQEWWHFDYTGECGAASATGCILSDTYAGYAANSFCKSSTTNAYTLALCTANVNDPSNPGLATCGGTFSGYSDYIAAEPWLMVQGCTETGKEYVFDEATRNTSLNFPGYTSEPTCQTP